MNERQMMFGDSLVARFVGLIEDCGRRSESCVMAGGRVWWSRVFVMIMMMMRMMFDVVVICLPLAT